MKQALDTRTKLLTKSPWPLMLEPVSYTHLDVYKRQASHRGLHGYSFSVSAAWRSDTPADIMAFVPLRRMCLQYCGGCWYECPGCISSSADTKEKWHYIQPEGRKGSLLFFSRHATGKAAAPFHRCVVWNIMSDWFVIEKCEMCIRDSLNTVESKYMVEQSSHYVKNQDRWRKGILSKAGF